LKQTEQVPMQNVKCLARQWIVSATRHSTLLWLMSTTGIN